MVKYISGGPLRKRLRDFLYFAPGWTTLICLPFIILVITLTMYGQYRSGALGLLLIIFSGTLALTLAVISTYWIRIRGNEIRNPALANPEWWRLPWWSALLKIMLIVLCTLLVRGAFSASPNQAAAPAYRFVRYLTYGRFVFVITTCFSLVGAIITISRGRHGYRDLFYSFSAVVAFIASVVGLVFNG